MGKKAGLLINELNSGKHDSVLRSLYAESTDKARQRYICALSAYIEYFGDHEVQIFSAPGRTEICGNHTDQQHGRALAAAVSMDAIAVAGLAKENRMLVRSDGYKRAAIIKTWQLSPMSYDHGASQGLIRGVASYLKKNGYKIGGFNVYVTSDVIRGSGLSSSAAFEVLIGTVINGLFNRMAIPAVEIAKAAQYAENVYFGKPCGLLDQMASSMGGMIHVDFENNEEPAFEKIEDLSMLDDYTMCITDTKGSHSRLTDEFSSIPNEMQQVAGMFGCDYLREVTPLDFYNRLTQIRETLGDRAALRAIHFFTEDDRVERMLGAIKDKNTDAFLKTVRASGDSSFKYLQNVYAPERPAFQPLSLALAVSDQILQGEGAARVHGGGFAGTIQAYVPHEKVAVYKQAMDLVFGQDACHEIRIRPQGSVRVI